MMKSKFALILLIFILLSPRWVDAQDKPTYQIFTSQGKKTDYTAMLAKMAASDVVFFGELHNNSLGHWLQMQLAKDLHSRDQSLSLGFEMFEADIQFVLDEYMSGKIDERNFLKDARTWDNYKTDYKPLIEFAKSNNLPAIATNIPRRYANLVFRKGLNALDSLGGDAKRFIAPLPIEVDLALPGYADMISSMAGHGPMGSPENMAYSQATKDATMAYYSSKFTTAKLLHFNGAYHSKNGEGILWYLKRYRPGLVIATIYTVEQKSIDKLNEEHFGAADFIICIPGDMAKSY